MGRSNIVRPALSIWETIIHEGQNDPNGLDPHTPGAKLDDGKLKAGVLLDFSRALRLVALVGTYGARKYSRGGWQYVENGIERYTDAMMRHMLLMPYEERDIESGLPHLAHFVWNALAILELTARVEGYGE